MPLTQSELDRVKYELGYHGLSVNAEPYVSHLAYFTQVLQPYLEAGAQTMSSTPVYAATTPTPQTLALVSASGFAVGNVVVVDVDARQERATISHVAGNSITLQLSKAHGPGSFLVLVEGAESIVRDILNELRTLTVGMNGQSGTLSALKSRVGLRRVDDVEFHGGGNSVTSTGVDPMTSILELRERWRDELANVLGIERLNSRRDSGGGSSMAVF